MAFRTTPIAGLQGGLLLGLTCTAVGLLTAWHYYAYWNVQWLIALWWGLKDWYLWGLIAFLTIPAIAQIGRQDYPLAAKVLVLAALGLACALAHAALAVSLSFLAEYDGAASWSEVVAGHVAKKAPLSATVYLCIVALAHLSSSRQARPVASAASPVEGPPQRLLVRRRGREHFVSTADISRVSAEGNYVQLHTRQGTFLERRTLRSLEEMLAGNGFVRVHRSHIVNLDAVDNMEPSFNGAWEVILRDGSRVPMGRTYRRKLAESVGERW